MLPCRHYWFSWGSDEAQSEWMGMYGYECMLKLFWTNPKYKQSTKELYRIRIIHTTIGSIKEVLSKHLARLVQDTFRIGSDLNELHWFRIASGYVPCLQGSSMITFPESSDALVCCYRLVCDQTSWVSDLPGCGCLHADLDDISGLSDRHGQRASRDAS